MKEKFHGKLTKRLEEDHNNMNNRQYVTEEASMTRIIGRTIMTTRPS